MESYFIWHLAVEEFSK